MNSGWKCALDSLFSFLVEKIMFTSVIYCLNEIEKEELYDLVRETEGFF